MDFVEQLGPIGLGCRLKRTQELIHHETGALLKKLNIDFEPRWLPVFSLVAIKGRMGIVEAAQELGVTQPAISQFCRELISVDLITVEKDAKDSRKRIMRLSKPGRRMSVLLRPVFTAMQKALKDVIDETEIDLYQATQKFERALLKTSIAKRAMDHIENAESQAVKVVGYNPKYKEDFRILNEEWITSMFDIEVSDRRVLENPEEEIINKGGKIFIAVLPNGEAVGTCALKPDAQGRFELSKMAVTAKMRGQRIGEMLLRRCIWQTKMLKKDGIYLMTNTDCEAAIHIYKKLGFTEAPQLLENYKDYERVNYAMEYAITDRDESASPAL